MSKKISDYVPIFKDQGIDYVAAADAAGVGTQHQVVVVSGSAHTITLAKEMASTSYTAVASSNEAARPAAIGTKEVSSVVVTGLNAGDEVNIIVIGQLKGQEG